MILSGKPEYDPGACGFPDIRCLKVMIAKNASLLCRTGSSKREEPKSFELGVKDVDR